MSTTPPDIIRLASEAGFDIDWDFDCFTGNKAELELFATLVISDFLQRTGQYVKNDASRKAAIAEAVAAEREACAQMCDKAANPEPEYDAMGYLKTDTATELSAAIRSRGKPATPPVVHEPWCDATGIWGALTSCDCGALKTDTQAVSKQP